MPIGCFYATYLVPTYWGVPRFHSIEGPNCWPELPWKNAGLPVTMHLSPWKAGAPSHGTGQKKRTPTDRKQLLWTLNIISPYTEGYTRQHAWNCVFFSVHLFSAAMNKKLNRTTFCWGSPAQDWNHEKKWKSLRHLKNLCQDLDTWINTTMISFRQSSEYGNVGPLPNGRTNCLYIGLTNCLLTGMILQARTVGTPSKNHIAMPIGSMYGIFTYIYHKNQPNVCKYTIHGSLGDGKKQLLWMKIYL